ncbi:MFS transporter [Burkholderia sp. L27(2015)]|uniref:MFS transporter n=1 Tax=Burkholderia sp. L27(2015) TaxID=1641858 RepID=UPI00131B8BAC|nr:MFS transporter [Burkholderia sp. L27(2015)]
MDRRLFVLALGMFALGTDSFVVAGLLPEIADGFHVSIGAAGQMTTVYAVTYALLAPVIAAFAAHVPRKRLLLGGLSVFVVANLGTAVAPTFVFALATRAVAGLGAAMFGPTATGSATLIVSPERRGFAISVVIAGMTISTALGAPIGAWIGSLGNWHWTMVFVAALAAASGLGVSALLSHIPMPAPVSLSRRLAPLADARIGLTLATTFLFFAAAFTIYTYLSVVFDRAIGGNSAMLGGFLVLWGAAGTVSNLMVGRLVDSIGSRKVLITMLVIMIADFALLPWTSGQLWSAIPAILIWGACGWGILVPQQHRIVTIAPSLAPIVLGLNNSATFLGTTVAGLIGAAGLQVIGGHDLGFIAAVLATAALVASEFASRKIIFVDHASVRTNMIGP